MSSREKILAAIKQNKPGEIELPAFHFSGNVDGNLFEKFSATLTGIGGDCFRIGGYGELHKLVEQKQLEGKLFIQTINELTGYNATDFAEADAQTLQLLDTVIIKGDIAVAENGSVWIPEANMVNRLLPFICEHLIIVVEEKNIVDTMHHAYQKIKVDENGYGVFIAGPSKTADIEQSLVIGAHGPLGLQVYVVEN